MHVSNNILYLVINICYQSRDVIYPVLKGSYYRKNINMCIFGQRSQRVIIDFLWHMKYTAQTIGESDY
jgi:hypothetical protein